MRKRKMPPPPPPVYRLPRSRLRRLATNGVAITASANLCRQLDADDAERAPPFCVISRSILNVLFYFLRAAYEKGIPGARISPHFSR